MKAQMIILALTTALVACNTKKAAEPEPLAQHTETEAEEEAAPETEAEEAEEEAEHDMVVSLEDIEKAAEAYLVLHDEELSMDEKRSKFEAFLEENDWAVDAYADLMYDIAQHSASRAYYIKKISE